MNKVKNLGYERGLIYKQPRQESSFCCFSFARSVTELSFAIETTNYCTRDLTH